MGPAALVHAGGYHSHHNATLGNEVILMMIDTQLFLVVAVNKLNEQSTQNVLEISFAPAGAGGCYGLRNTIPETEMMMLTKGAMLAVGAGELVVGNGLAVLNTAMLMLLLMTMTIDGHRADVAMGADFVVMTSCEL